MAYREVRMIDIDQVIRRWLAGERIRAVARTTGLDRNTVRRLIRLGQQVGLKLGDAPDEAKLQQIRQRMGRRLISRSCAPIFSLRAVSALPLRKSNLEGFAASAACIT